MAAADRRTVRSARVAGQAERSRNVHAQRTLASLYRADSRERVGDESARRTARSGVGESVLRLSEFDRGTETTRLAGRRGFDGWREDNLLRLRKRRSKKTTDSTHGWRGTGRAMMNQLWAADAVHAVRLPALILEHVVGWAPSETELQQALRQRRPITRLAASFLTRVRSMRRTNPSTSCATNNVTSMSRAPTTTPSPSSFIKLQNLALQRIREGPDRRFHRTGLQSQAPLGVRVQRSVRGGRDGGLTRQGLYRSACWRRRDAALRPHPALIVSMSPQPGIPRRGALQQSPPPLPRLLPSCDDTLT